MSTRFVRPSVSVQNAPGRGCFSSLACCSCFNLGFLQTTPGVFKLAELIMGSVCQTMMINFGRAESALLGMSYISLLTTVSASVSTVTLLLACYIFSKNSFGLIRSSIFEILFNFGAAVSYISSSIYLAVVVNFALYPLYLVTLGFIAYPAMIAAYSLGFGLGLIHAIDAYSCYTQFRSY